MVGEIITPGVESANFARLAGEVVGRSAEESFSMEFFHLCNDYKITSPIEQLFYIAMLSSQHVHGLECKEHYLNGELQKDGVDIYPQHNIGKYRVDFMVSWFWQNKENEQQVKTVIVECDSQSWHERTEKERRYEKKRDRFFSTKGLHSFHFTGNEIMEDPYKPACEVLAFLDPWRNSDSDGYLYGWIQEFIES